jgi:hypothetical protein
VFTDASEWIVGITGQSLPALALDLDWLSADRRGLFVAPR